MTKIIKKKKRLTDEEIQEKKIKSEGKNLQQSGDFFQKNKNVVTWVLVIIFLSTCFGISGLLFTGCNEENKPGQTSQTGKPVEKDEFVSQISYQKQALSADPSNEVLMTNLAYSYQDAAMQLQTKDEISGKNENASRISEYMKEAELNYQNALRMKPGYAFAIVNLITVYLDSNQNEKAIALGEEYLKSENLLDRKPVVSPQESDPDKMLKASEEDLSPVLAKLALAYAHTGKNEEFDKIAAKALEMNPQDLELVYTYANRQHTKGDEKAKRSALELAERAASQAASINSNATSKRLNFGQIKLSVNIFELLGDIYAESKDKKKAEEAYNTALSYANILQNKEKTAEIGSKMSKAGIEAPVTITSQKETSEGIEIKLSNGKVVKLSKEELQKERTKAIKEKKERERQQQP